jgi:hypothetical protein
MQFRVAELLSITELLKLSSMSLNFLGILCIHKGLLAPRKSWKVVWLLPPLFLLRCRCHINLASSLNVSSLTQDLTKGFTPKSGKSLFQMNIFQELLSISDISANK